MNENTDYPSLFRRMIVRSTEAALAAIDFDIAVLEQEDRERSLNALGLALDLSAAWHTAQQLLITISPHMRWQGYRDEWIAYLEKGINAAKNQEDPAMLAKLYHQLGWLHQQMNLYQQAREQFMLAYELAVQENDIATQIGALDQLSSMASQDSDFSTAKSYVEDVFRLTDQDDPRRGFGCSVLGFIALQQGEWDEAISWYSQSVRFHVASGEYRFAAQSEQALAYVYATTRQCQEALAHYQQVLNFLSNYPSVLDIAMTQMEIGLVYTYMDDYKQAIAMYKLCEPVFVSTGSKLSLSHLYNNYGLAYTGIGDFEKAEQTFVLSIELARNLNMPRLIANAMESKGMMYQKMGRLDQAITTWEQALAELIVLADPPQYLHKLIVRRIEEARSEWRNPAPGSSCLSDC